MKNNTSGGGKGEIALCRMYMYFKHAWSRQEAFRPNIEYNYIHVKVFKFRHPGLRITKELTTKS